MRSEGLSASKAPPRWAWVHCARWRRRHWPPGGTSFPGGSRKDANSLLPKARGQSLARALTAGDRPSVSRLCAESFAGARDLYEICSPPMAAMMNAMLSAPGVIGARQAGAGFGGCMVALVDAACSDAFRAAVVEAYRTATNLMPEIYAVEAAPGAEVFAREKVGQ